MPAKILVHNSTKGQIERDNYHRCSNLSHCSPSGSRPWVANIFLIVQLPPPPPPPPPHHPPPTLLLSLPPILKSTREKVKKFILEKTSTPPLSLLHNHPPPDYYLLSELTRIHVVLFIFVTHSVDCDYHCNKCITESLLIESQMEVRCIFLKVKKIRTDLASKPSIWHFLGKFNWF